MWGNFRGNERWFLGKCGEVSGDEGRLLENVGKFLGNEWKFLRNEGKCDSKEGMAKRVRRLVSGILANGMLEDGMLADGMLGSMEIKCCLKWNIDSNGMACCLKWECCLHGNGMLSQMETNVGLMRLGPCNWRNLRYAKRLTCFRCASARASEGNGGGEIHGTERDVETRRRLVRSCASVRAAGDQSRLRASFLCAEVIGWKR